MNRNELEVAVKDLTMEVVSSKDFQREVVNLGRKTKELNDLYDQVKKGLKTFMEKEQLDKIEGECMNITYVGPVVKEGVDSKQILIDHPEYKQMYPKNTISSSYITVKVK